MLFSFKVSSIQVEFARCNHNFNAYSFFPCTCHSMFSSQLQSSAVFSITFLLFSLLNNVSFFSYSFTLLNLFTLCVLMALLLVMWLIKNKWTIVVLISKLWSAVGLSKACFKDGVSWVHGFGKMFSQFPWYHSHGRGCLRLKVPLLESSRVKEYDYCRIFRVTKIAVKMTLNFEFHMSMSHVHILVMSMLACVRCRRMGE